MYYLRLRFAILLLALCGGAALAQEQPLLILFEDLGLA